MQGNIPPYEKWDAQHVDRVLDQYGRLTRLAAAEGPDLIVWPESAMPDYLIGNPKVYKTVINLVRQTQIPLVLGSAAYGKSGGGQARRTRQRNSAFLIDPLGKVRFAYDKIILLPFAEYTPLAGKFVWPRWLAPTKGELLAGTQLKIFSAQDSRFGVTICWEVFFSNLFRRFVEAGAQFMVNLADEGWFGDSTASRQLLAIAVFRSVENRVSLLRATNTGISSLIDPAGRILARVTDEAGKEVMVSGLLTVSIPQGAAPAFYTRYGDVFAMSAAALAGALMLLASLPWRVRRRLGMG